MTTQPNDADALIRELNQETENASAPKTETSTAIDEDHFEEVKETPDQKLTDEPQASSSMIKAMAKSWVNRINTIIRMIFTPIYKVRILEEGDIERITEFR